MRPSLDVTRAALLIAAPAAAAIAGLLVVVALLGFRADGLPDGAWTLANHRALLDDPALWEMLRNTAVYVTVTLAVALALGVALAWLVERTDLGARRTLHAAMVLRVLVPGFFTALGWLFLLHPRIGTVNRWLGTSLDVASPVGMGVVEGVSLSAVVFVMAAGALRSLDASLEEAARANGAGAATVLRRVTLPLLRPALAGASVVVAMIAISSFDVPLVLGLGDDVLVLSSYLYVESRPADGVPSYGAAAAVSGAAIALGCLVAWWYTRTLARGAPSVGGRGHQVRPVRLGRWRWAAWAFVAATFAWSTALPLLIVLWMSLQPFARAPSLDALGHASFDNYRELDWALVGRGLETTAKLMLLAPTLALLLSLAFAWIVVRSRLRVRRAFDALALLPLAIPPLVLAFGAMLASLHWSRGWYDVYGSLVLLVAVMALVHVAFGTRLLNAALASLHVELEEAAALSGASSWTRLRRIVLPLLRPALLSTWLWLAALSFRDLTLPTLLGSQDTLTLSMVVWSLLSTNNAGEAAAVTLAMLALLGPLVGLVLWAERGRTT